VVVVVVVVAAAAAAAVIVTLANHIQGNQSLILITSFKFPKADKSNIE
jgi:hypothetical protein